MWVRRIFGSLLAGLVGIGLATGVAHAAGLGGAASGSFGADSTLVASCDTTGVSLDYTTGYDPALARYAVTAVTVRDLDPSCVGQTVAVVLHDDAGTELAAASTTAASDTVTVRLAAGPPVDATIGTAIVVSR